jgi:hypothetical protein
MGEVAILVSSCESYCRTVTPRLLASLAREGVPARDVFVVIGETPAPERASTYQAGGMAVAAWHVPYVNFDNNALLWAVSDAGRAALAGYEWALLVHDTVEVLSGFLDRVQGRLRCVSDDVHAFRLKPGWSMSMGYYRLATLWAHASAMTEAVRVNHVATTPEDSKFAIKFGGVDRDGTEDVVFRWLERLVPPGGVRVLNEHGAGVRASTTCVYDTDTQRVTEVFPDPGLAKHKANWGQGGMHVTP